MPNDTWKRLGPVAGGGTVASLAISPVRRVLGVLVSPTPHIPLYWAATSCGVFRSYTSGVQWKQYLAGLTTPSLSALAVALNGYLFAGAIDGSVFYSNDFGLNWQPGVVKSGQSAPVTAMVASPNFRQDHAGYAATAGAGILMTRDAGKTWRDASSGLGSRVVLALAASPAWAKRETMFAAAADGVYISRNAGRAWRRLALDLDDDVAAALAVSPAFESDSTVYVGTEGGRLYRSMDGGREWTALQPEIGEGGIGALWLARDFGVSGRMVCGAGAELYVSSDWGASWQLAAQTPGAVLALTGDERSVIAGLHDAGVWESRDAGLSWQPATGDLAARSYAWLKAAGDSLYAIGPQEGVWLANGDGDWRGLTGLEAHLPLTAACTIREDALLVASTAGDLLRSTDRGQTWEVVGAAPGAQALLLSPDTDDGWAGTADGRLLVSHDSGATWQDVGTPCQGQAILSLAASPRFKDDRTLLMGTAIPASDGVEARVGVWLSTDAGAAWRLAPTQPTSARWADIAMSAGAPGEPLPQALVAAGPYVLRPMQTLDGGWESAIVDPAGANVLSVVSAGEGEFYAATTTGVFKSNGGGRAWRPFVEGLPEQTYVGLAAAQRGEKRCLYALSLGGVVWARELG